MSKKEIEQLVQDFIEKTYEKGIEDAKKQMRGSYAMGVIDGKKEAITHEKAIDFLEETGWKEAHDKEMIEHGMSMAWECVKKIVYPTEDGGLSADDLKEIFGDAFPSYIVRNFSPSEAIQKIKDYEERQKQKEKIRVGDEVYIIDKNHKSVVTSIIEDCGDTSAVIISDSGRWSFVECEKLNKTGKHYSQIEEVLKELRGDEE